MQDIKAIILDIDGVIIGNQEGVNTPLPNKAVSEKLKNIHKQIPIILCTSRVSFCTTDIIKSAELDGFHIADSGAIIFNPIKSEYLQKSLLPTNESKKIIDMALWHDVCTELNTPTDYYVQKSQYGQMNKDHAKVFNRNQKITDNLAELSKTNDVVSFALIVNGDDEKTKTDVLLKNLNLKSTVTWTADPTMTYARFAIITPQNTSKRNAVIRLSQKLDIPFENILGVGDTDGDWSFIELCKYGAAVGNATQSLKDKVKSKGEFGFIGESVNKNGLIGILKHFGIEDVKNSSC